ncbi:MAG: HPr family phosphocarrier protein [Thermodesulfobacteriota bacterium]
MPDQEYSRVLKIKNKLGLHARAAAVFVKTSSKYNSDIKIMKDGYKVNGKSILGVLSLAAIKGSEIQVVTSGTDADKAIKGIQELIDSGFGEGIEEE